MMFNRFPSTAILAIALVCQVGCVENDAKTQLRNLNNRLNRVLNQFESAESNFSSSTNSETLVQNAHWLDRMINYSHEVGRIEYQAVQLGADPLTELRSELDARLASHIRTIQSDMQFVDAMTQMEIAKIWLDM